MSFFKDNKLKIFSIICMATMLAFLIPMVQVGEFISPSKVFAETVDYYELKVGNETVVTFETEEAAYDVIEKVKDKFVDEEETVVDVKLTPAITVEKISVPKNEAQPAVENNVSKALDILLDTDSEASTYTVQEGDTIWAISETTGMSVDEIEAENPELDLENIVPGDEISLRQVESLINVIVEYETQSEVVVPFDTVYEEDPEMYVDEEEYVLVDGQDGSRIVTERVVTTNGVTTRVEEVGSEMVLEPVSQVIVIGGLERPEPEPEPEPEEDYYDEIIEEEPYAPAATSSTSEASQETSSQETAAAVEEAPAPKVEEAPAPATYGGDGQAIVNYALQFVGNPYAWGGTSLTNGCDCSGFVYRVFNDCGYSIARWPDNYFPHISASELRPGDVVVYSGHYAIYIGDGRAVSALNYARGIDTHPLYYGGTFLYGLRIVG